jgi:hypothetical protein
MSDPLGRIIAKRKTGREPLTSGSTALGVELADFWAWSSSDLLGNTQRGILAEFIVARALGIATDGVREEWATWDLTTPCGIKVEVKSAAYIQSWGQKALSAISFSTRRTVAWDAVTGIYNKDSRRHADVYVFALFAHQDKSSANPLDVDQWRFFVVPTATLDGRPRSQHSVTLNSLKALCGGDCTFAGLAATVTAAIPRPPADDPTC